MEDKNAALTYAEVQKAILAFHERWKRPGIDDLPSRLSPMHSKDPVEWVRLWAGDGDPQKHSRKAGVYFFFDTDQTSSTSGQPEGSASAYTNTATFLAHRSPNTWRFCTCPTSVGLSLGRSKRTS